MIIAQGIHNYDHLLANLIDYLKNKSGERKSSQIYAEVPEEDKKLLSDYDHYNFVIEALSKARRIKVITVLLRFRRDFLKANFKAAGVTDLKESFAKINSRDDYSPWTKVDYRTVVKKFYKWIAYGDNTKDETTYPDIIKWVKTHLKSKDTPRVQAGDLLTEEEIELLIKSAGHTRDKAFISMLYELGARIGEIGNLKIKDITKDQYGYLVDLNGKTGHRTPRIIISAPYITAWLNQHPDKNNPESPVWIITTDGKSKGEKMEYGSLRMAVQRITQRAKIKKRIYPHLFRHTRATHLLGSGMINEAQAKVYFGWTPGSDMLAEYAHLVSADVNNALLEMHGIKTDESRKQAKLKPKICAMCQTVNTKDSKFCQKCGNVLDVQTAIEIDDKRKKSDDLMNVLLKDPEMQKMMLKKMLKLGLGQKLMEL